MRKNFALLALGVSIAGALCAQQKNDATLSPDDRLFGLPPYTIGYKARADLGKGNILELELVQHEDLARFRNIDSLLLVFLSDMKPLEDSLNDPLTAKRIDYLMDPSGTKKVRIRQSRLSATSYLLDGGEPALLRLQQDTIYLLLPVPPATATGEKNIQRYDRLGLYINRYEELSRFITTGLNEQMSRMQTHGVGHTVAELSLRWGATLQNYKSYFTPSFNLGIAFAVQSKGSRNTFIFDWEPVFLFSNDAQGRLQTYRNDFLVFGYSNRKARQSGWGLHTGGPADGDKPNIGIHFDVNVSLAYLIDRQGEYFRKHTFRFCPATINLANNHIKVQPCMYFNDFLRGITPGVRVTF